MAGEGGPGQAVRVWLRLRVRVRVRVRVFGTGVQSGLCRRALESNSGRQSIGSRALFPHTAARASPTRIPASEEFTRTPDSVNSLSLDSHAPHTLLHSPVAYTRTAYTGLLSGPASVAPLSLFVFLLHSTTGFPHHDYPSRQARPHPPHPLCEPLHECRRGCRPSATTHLHRECSRVSPLERASALTSVERSAVDQHQGTPRLLVCPLCAERRPDRQRPSPARPPRLHVVRRPLAGQPPRDRRRRSVWRRDRPGRCHSHQQSYRRRIS